MKIEIEVNDLKTFIDGFNNALIAYNDIQGYFLFGLEKQLNSKWQNFAKDKKNNQECYDIINKRLNALKEVYNQLLEVEKSDKRAET